MEEKKVKMNWVSSGADLSNNDWAVLDTNFRATPFRSLVNDERPIFKIWFLTKVKTIRSSGVWSEDWWGKEENIFADQTPKKL